MLIRFIKLRIKNKLILLINYFIFIPRIISLFFIKIKVINWFLIVQTVVINILYTPDRYYKRLIIFL